MQKAKRGKRGADAYPFARYKANKLRRIERHIVSHLNDVAAQEAHATVKALTAFRSKRYGNSRAPSQAAQAMRLAQANRAAS